MKQQRASVSMVMESRGQMNNYQLLRSDFNTRAVRVEFVVDEVAMG
jgi:hypothetical protein